MALGCVYVTFFGWKITATSEQHRHGHNSPTSGEYPCIYSGVFPITASFYGVRIVQCNARGKVFQMFGYSAGRYTVGVTKKKTIFHIQMETSVGWFVTQKRFQFVRLYEALNKSLLFSFPLSKHLLSLSLWLQTYIYKHIHKSVEFVSLWLTDKIQTLTLCKFKTTSLGSD